MVLPFVVTDLREFCGPSEPRSTNVKPWLRVPIWPGLTCMPPVAGPRVFARQRDADRRVAPRQGSDRWRNALRWKPLLTLHVVRGVLVTVAVMVEQQPPVIVPAPEQDHEHVPYIVTVVAAIEAAGR
jgi:hypothetical protein